MYERDVCRADRRLATVLDGTTRAPGEKPHVVRAAVRDGVADVAKNGSPE